MAARFSTGLRTALLAEKSLRAALENSEIRLYAGPVPASVDTAISAQNQLLCTLKNNGSTGVNFETTAPEAVLSKKATEVWRGTNVATGKATFYRHVLPSDTDVSSTTAPRIQGTVGIAGADMHISNPDLVNGAVQALEAYSIALPEV